MSRRFVIVTCADDRYFECAQSCIRSIRERLPAGEYTLAFLDAGCQAPQRRWLESHVDVLRTPAIHFEVAQPPPPHLLGLLARPYLRDYFPGFETYLWMDADAWLQAEPAIEMLVQGACLRRGLAIVPEVDRCSLQQYGRLPAYWRQAHGWYADHFGKQVADRLHCFPMLNAGVFALHEQAPHWDRWSQAIAQALRARCSVMTDQIALNYMVYTSGLFSACELLPAWCNWTCHNGFPMWDEQHQCFVEPYLPRTKIGIMHVTTRDKTGTRELWTSSGRRQRVRIFFPAQAVG